MFDEIDEAITSFRDTHIVVENLFIQIKGPNKSNQINKPFLNYQKSCSAETNSP